MERLKTREVRERERERERERKRKKGSHPRLSPSPPQKKKCSHSSAFSEEFRDARGFGWASSPPPFDWRALVDRKGREVERLNAVYNRLLTSAGVNLFEGRAALEAPHRVRVEAAAGRGGAAGAGADGGGGMRVLTARHVLVATGGSAVKAAIPGAEEFAITSDDALVLEDLPLPQGGAPPRGPVVLVGAGYISLEFAGIFAGLGCDVRVLYRKELPLAGFDGECRGHVAECMRGRGISMMPGTSPTRHVFFLRVHPPVVPRLFVVLKLSFLSALSSVLLGFSIEFFSVGRNSTREENKKLMEKET